MAINFPNSPTLNEEFTAGDRTWIWDGTVWNSKETAFTTPGIPTGGATAQLLAKVDGADYNTEWRTSDGVRSFADASARATAIPSPTEGMTTYIEDADRLDFYNGTAHVPAAGLTFIKSETFSAVTSVPFTSIFNSTYRDYLFVFSGFASSTGNDLLMRLRSGVSDNVDNQYFMGSVRIDNFGGPTRVYAGGQTSAVIGPFANFRDNFSLLVSDPFNPVITTSFGQITAIGSSNIFTSTFLSHNVTNSFDGINFIMGSGTFSGTINAYGYRR
jgi:hypothetical protein